MTEFQIDRPVVGDVQKDSRRSVPQISGAEFLAQIDAALAVPGIHGLIWDQYTPYFNDGDPCEFSVGDVRALLSEAEVNQTDEDDDDRDYRDYERGISDYELLDDYEYVGKWPDRHIVVKSWKPVPSGSAEEIYNALRSLRTGSWEAVALENFGDHATVVATKDGFNVEFYEHD